METISDKNYFYDIDGNVTTDESKAERWLARTGAAVLPEHQEALKAFQGADTGKVTPKQDDEELDEESAKSAKPSANKAAKPTANKGAK